MSIYIDGEMVPFDYLAKIRASSIIILMFVDGWAVFMVISWILQALLPVFPELAIPALYLFINKLMFFMPNYRRGMRMLEQNGNSISKYIESKIQKIATKTEGS